VNVEVLRCFYNGWCLNAVRKIPVQIFMVMGGLALIARRSYTEGSNQSITFSFFEDTFNILCNTA